MIALIGLVGVLFVELSILPQIVKTYRTKKASDISLMYLTLLLLGLLLLLLYSIIIYDVVFILGNSLSLSLTIVETVGAWKWKEK
jgi:MtN3 and saliva related transmembrane protein